MEQSRRDFLRKSAAAGGLVWAAPVITTVSRAHGQTAGTPVCVCSGQGTALSGFVTGPTGTVVLAPQGQSSGAIVCELTADQRVPATGDIFAHVQSGTLCGQFDEASCTGSASVENLDVTISTGPLATDKIAISADVLTSQANAPCDCSGTGDSLITNLAVSIAGINQNVSVTGEPDQSVALGPLHIVINEQTCEGDQSVVRALHIHFELPGVLTVHLPIAESKAGNTLCGCALAP